MFLGQSSAHEETAVITMMIDNGNDCNVYSYGGDYDVYDQRDSRFIVGGIISIIIVLCYINQNSNKIKRWE